jgi:hypothetical protein
MSSSGQYAAAARAAATSMPVATAATAARHAIDDRIQPVDVALTVDEYPSSVQELVMNGFDLSKVLRAYDLIGDNFDDLLSFLISSAN